LLGQRQRILMIQLGGRTREEYSCQYPRKQYINFHEITLQPSFSNIRRPLDLTTRLHVNITIYYSQYRPVGLPK